MVGFGWGVGWAFGLMVVVLEFSLYVGGFVVVGFCGWVLHFVLDLVVSLTEFGVL